jgi:RHS repeat-associated protein
MPRAASVSGIGYAAHNALNTETYGNGLIHAIDYNNRLQPTQIKLGTSGNPTSVVSLGYNYGTTDNNGNVRTHTYSGGGLSYTQTFGYDSLNRLTTSTESGSSWSQTNAYDRYGNRWIDLGGGNQNLYFNTSNNRITGASYDSAGNLFNDGTHAYTYDAENKIATVDNVSAYVYNGEGQRVRKLVGDNLRFVYGISGQLIADFSGPSGALQKEYIYGASGLLATIEPTAMNSNGTRYTTPDHLGSPRVVTNSGARVTSRHDYMPFGEEIGAGVGGRTTGMGFPGSSDGIRQKFTQKERDIETQLDYFEARYYGSTQGRFTSVDPLLASAKRRHPQTWNRYSYGLNNPLRYTDPDGEAAVDENDLEMRRTTTTTEVIVQDQDRRGNIIQQAKVTVTETQTEFLNANGQVDSSVDPITVTTAAAVNTGNGARNYTQDQLDTMANVAQNVVAVSREKLFDPTIALGVANTETRLGSAPPGESAAHKDPKINPMQLSATSGTTATTDLRSNIAGSIDVFNRSSASTNTLNQRLQDYNEESTKVAYANKAERQINQIRQSVKTKTTLIRLSIF